MLELVRDTLGSSAALDRHVFDADVLDRLLADPNTTRTTLGSNELWQLVTLELWLQTF